MSYLIELYFVHKHITYIDHIKLLKYKYFILWKQIKSAPLKYGLLQSWTVHIQIQIQVKKGQRKRKRKIMGRCKPCVRVGFGRSFDPTAESDPITNRKHADLDLGVGSECLVELQHEVPVVPNVLTKRRIRRRHNRTIPEGIVVANHSPYLNKVNQPLVIVYVVVLVGIHENEIK